MNRIWALGLLSVGAAFVVAACGGGTSTAPTATPAGDTTPAVGSTPTPSPLATEGAPGASSARYSWEVFTVDDDGAKPSLAIDAQGTPHIAYILEALPGFVKHAVLDGNAWDISTVSEGYFYGPLDILVDEQGVPHIAWHDHDEEDGAYAVLVDGKWESQNIVHSGHDGWDGDIVLDARGRPHIISIDPSQFGSQSSVEYATFDGQAWQVEEVGSGPVSYEFGTGIALDSQERPHVVWYDDSAGDLKYAVKDEGSWTISTVDGEGDVGRFPSLALDRQDNPIVSYYERTGDSEGYIKLARWDGSEWNVQRIDKLDDVFLGFLGARKNSSLVLDPDDNPIVAYSDEQAIKLAWHDGSQWNLEPVLTAGDSPLHQQVSLALDSNGDLHLTFADVERRSDPGVRGPIKYARGTLEAPTAPSLPE